MSDRTEQYEKPQISVLGKFHELTLQDKAFGSSDGFTINGQPVINASQS